MHIKWGKKKKKTIVNKFNRRINTSVMLLRSGGGPVVAT